MEKTLSSSSKKSDLTAGFRSLHPRQGTTTTPTICLPLLFSETKQQQRRRGRGRAQSRNAFLLEVRAIEGGGGEEKKVALKRDVRFPGVSGKYLFILSEFGTVLYAST